VRSGSIRKKRLNESFSIVSFIFTNLPFFVTCMGVFFVVVVIVVFFARVNKSNHLLSITCR